MARAGVMLSGSEPPFHRFRPLEKYGQPRDRLRRFAPRLPARLAIRASRRRRIEHARPQRRAAATSAPATKMPGDAAQRCTGRAAHRTSRPRRPPPPAARQAQLGHRGRAARRRACRRPSPSANSARRGRRLVDRRALTEIRRQAEGSSTAGGVGRAVLAIAVAARAEQQHGGEADPAADRVHHDAAGEVVSRCAAALSQPWMPKRWPQAAPSNSE